MFKIFARAGVIILIGWTVLFGDSCTNLASAPSLPPAQVAGAWDGESYPGCRSFGKHCPTYRLISMNITQAGSGLTGSYACAFGNRPCTLADHTGTIVSGRMEGSFLPELRIGFSDATDCLYNGHFTGDTAEGGYLCFSGGRSVEGGSWNLERKTSSSGTGR